MQTPTLHIHPAVSLAIAAFLSIGIALAQDKPDRPPWAQPPKPKSAPDPNIVSNPPASPAPSSPSSSSQSATIVQPSAPAPPADSNQDSAAQRGRIRVNVNLVNVLVSVLDDHNRPAPDLPRESFQLFEEDVEQKIDVFESETSQPLDLALMIDASLSAHKEISFEQEAAAHFIRQVLRPGDRLSVFSFDEDVTQRAAFSDNVAALQEAVRKIPDGAGTSIYDAVLLGSRALERRGDDRRRVIILVTDAGETTSSADFDAARKEAVRSNTLLYTIVIRPVKNESGRNTAGEHALETMTDTTGGAMFYPDTPQELGAIFDRIDHELRTQYRLAYYPNPRGPANTFRSILVTVRPVGYHVRHRRSYLTGPQ
ncbi:MAG TPA: VWA domain-containing protein [Candidatus Acidoferrum sp.]|nr:VWA domain-containing protein [Candidatus Acidoferrum sp.]